MSTCWAWSWRSSERDQFSSFLSEHANSVPALVANLKELTLQITQWRSVAWSATAAITTLHHQLHGERALRTQSKVQACANADPARCGHATAEWPNQVQPCDRRNGDGLGCYLTRARTACISDGEVDRLRCRGGVSCRPRNPDSCPRTIRHGCRLQKRACGWRYGRGTNDRG